MLTQIQSFDKNALAFHLTESFTEKDAGLIKQLFEEKLNQGFSHVNLLIQVKDLSVMTHLDWKAFLKGEIWGFRHFGKIGRCAVVADSAFIRSAVKIESRLLHLANAAFEEKYFDTAELEAALKFISPGE